MKRTVIINALGALSLAFATESFAAGHAGAAATPPSMATGGAAHGTKTTTLGPTHPTGQPNQTCGSASAPNTPGNAASAPGSAFNSSGTAGGVYAGEQSQNSRNVASVSQYDVACAHQR
jgi:hypothetical protein